MKSRKNLCILSCFLYLIMLKSSQKHQFLRDPNRYRKGVATMRYLAKRVERICDELYRLRIVQRMEWTERGPVRATLGIERKVSRSVICQKIHFYAACPRIDFETTVD